MGKQNDYSQSIKEIKDVVSNESWFKNIPYQWPTASLPFAYAVDKVKISTG
jgi:hypothetical protein